MSGRTCQLVELEGECDGKEEQLVGNSDDGGDGKVVFVQYMDRLRHGESGLCAAGCWFLVNEYE